MIISLERAEFLSDQLVYRISWNDSLSLGVCIEAPKRLVGAGTSGSSGGGRRVSSEPGIRDLLLTGQGTLGRGPLSEPGFLGGNIKRELDGIVL